ncbi:ubiquinone anaerobic biosynthesis accessory factor UbiT [Gynuella sp.]|uniref:ubiquinone anaerobic biosynthesis accessory factor UbiT n=1 Tax=Gynuella sp. TaxID=2969146 RepID=UPI003D1271F7
MFESTQVLNVASRMSLIWLKTFALAPVSLQSRLVSSVVTQCFRQQLAEDEFDFLQGRWVTIELTDAAMCWSFTVDEHQHFLMRPGQTQSESRIKGPIRAFLKLMSRTVDPDTLFFQRELVISGDTELGLAVKNLFDSIEPEDLPNPFRITLQKLHQWSRP